MQALNLLDEELKSYQTLQGTLAPITKFAGANLPPAVKAYLYFFAKNDKVLTRESIDGLIDKGGDVLSKIVPFVGIATTAYSAVRGLTKIYINKFG